MDKIISIAGMPGSGKSCAAKELAAQLSASGHPARWIDLDAEVERRAGKSLARIFAEGGEPAFRSLEKATLQDILEGDISILALGGGTLEDKENLELVKKYSHCIWLDTPLETIADRLWAQGNIGKRPLLASAKTKKELLELLQNLYNTRKANYKAAAKEIR